MGDRWRASWHRIWPLARIALILLITLALIITALLWKEWLRLSHRPPGNPLLTQPRETVSSVSPNTLLLLLADEPPNALAWEAINRGDVTTAHIILSQTLTLSGNTRADLLRANLSLLPPRDSLAAEEAYMLYTTAILYPRLSDSVRLNILLTLLPYWQGPLGAPGKEATVRSIQAILAASPTLRPAQRQAAMAALRQAGVSPTPIPRPPLPQRPLRAPVFQVPPPPPVLPGDVERAQQRRRQAALALARSPNNDRARRVLASALQAEDVVREHFFTNAIAATPTPDEQVRIAWDYLRWATYREMVAQQSFGVSLIPAWEEQRETFLLKRIKTWEQFVGFADDWMAAQPDIVGADQGAYELWRWVAWAGEMGLYPRYPREPVWTTLQDRQKAYFGHPEIPWQPWVTWDEHIQLYVLTSPRP